METHDDDKGSWFVFSEWFFTIFISVGKILQTQNHLR
jgi:hypothetical protein